MRRSIDILLPVVLSALLFGPHDASAVQVDFLWVIDNSPSMAGEQAVLAAAADDMAARLASARCAIDWRMAVTYTDLHLAPTTADTCLGAPGPGRRRLCPFTRDIGLFQNGAAECAYVKAGTCGDGAERGFDSARSAITRLLAGAGCEPVPGAECSLRPEARLVTVFLTDTGEQTPNRSAPPGQPDNSIASWAHYFGDYDLLMPGLQRAQVHGILCPLRPDALHPAPCSDTLVDAALFDRYSDLVRVMGGTEGSVQGDEQSLADTVGHIVDAAIVGACCGDGVIEPGEQCDDGNALDGDCCSAACQLEPLGTVCRPAAGACDVAEVCTGASPACPADDLRPAMTECRPVAGPCDVAEACTGTSPACPKDAFKARAVGCRPVAGVCDVAESCTGRSAACPVDAFKPEAVECRPQAGPCDAAERCTGSGALCGPDDKSTAVCRAAAGPCDTDEQCDGVGNNCPPDVYAPATVECRPAAGACDLAERCTGSGASCPPDAKSTAVCRATAGPCDLEERCDGMAEDCPADAYVPATATCRPSAGACDPAEHCTGATAGCPPDEKRTNACRPAAGPCDAEERCDGVTDTCPTDRAVSDGASCDDQDACTRSDACLAGACVGANPVACGPADQCRDAGVCDRTTGTCAYAARADGLACDDGDACTRTDACQAGVCTGTNPVVCGPYTNECSRGECNSLTGKCSKPQPLSGVPCAGGTGTCASGTCNRPPDCSAAVASPRELWPPNHKWVSVGVTGVKDPDRDRVTITITGVMQDEPIYGFGIDDGCPDASGIGKATAKVRAERYSTGAGRLYYVSYLADDGRGGQCSGTVPLCTPHDRKTYRTCVDQGLRVDSAGACR